LADQHVVVIGASAGGVETLSQFCRLLPPDFNAAVLIVLHIPSHGKSNLPSILSRVGALPARHAENGQVFEAGNIYIAPPNHHLLAVDGRLSLSLGPKINGLRPAVDVLFQSAAKALGKRVIGVVLSGTRGDGAVGLLSIKQAGGVTMVQDPGEALFPTMPTKAMEMVEVDYVLGMRDLVAKIVELLAEEPGNPNGGKVMSVDLENEDERLRVDHAHFEGGDESSPRTLLTCPSCGGVLWELNSNGILHYHCQIGHVFSEESLLSEHTDYVEESLWSAVRLLEERASMGSRLSSRAGERGLKKSAQSFRSMAEEAERMAGVIRNMLLQGGIIFPQNVEQNGNLPPADMGDDQIGSADKD
jgi:two-component system chemotaxis response regulator CheB